MKLTQRIKTAFKFLLGGISFGRFATITSSGKLMRRQSAETDPYSNFAGWVYLAIDKIGEAVGRIDPRLYSLRSNGDLEELEDHELLSLIHRANPLMTKFDLFYLTAVFLRLWGSAPWYLEKVNKKIVNVWPMRPDLLKMTQSEAGEIIGWEYWVGGRVERFNADEILYIRKPNPQNPLKGFGAVQAAALEIDADAAAAIWNKYFLENNAEPAGVLETEQSLDDSQFERLQKLWQSRYAGPSNAGRPAILEAGLKWHATSTNPKEMDFIKSREFSRDAILTMLGVPKALVIADDVNRANADNAERFFAKQTVEPLMRLITDQLNEFLVPKFGDNLWLDFDPPMTEDREQKRLEAQAANNMWQTVNETREAYGLPPLEGGDELYLPMALLPTMGPEKNVKLLKKSDVAKPPSVKERRIKQAILARTYLKRKIVDSVVEKTLKKIESKNQVVVKAKIVIRGDDDDADLHTSLKAERLEYLKRLTTQQKEFTEVMRNYFDDQKRIVQENLRSEGLPKGIKLLGNWLRKILFDRTEQVAGLVKISKNIYKENIQEGAAAIARLLGMALADIGGSPIVAQYLLDKPIKFATEINDTTLDALRRTLSDGVDAGESLGQLGNRVADVFEEARGFRTERIVRTEVGSAQNFGRTEEMKLQNVEKKVWLAIFSNTREDHAAAHGKVVRVDEAFNVGGESLMYPQDPAGSPDNIINCQCSVSPTLRDLT